MHACRLAGGSSEYSIQMHAVHMNRYDISIQDICHPSKSSHTGSLRVWDIAETLLLSLKSHREISQT